MALVGHVAVLSNDRLTVFSLELGNELWNAPLADRYATLLHLSLPVTFVSLFSCIVERSGALLCHQAVAF